MDTVLPGKLALQVGQIIGIDYGGDRMMKWKKDRALLSTC